MVVYVLCFDLSQPIDAQRAQVQYWLDFLNSALSLPPVTSKYSGNSNWVIMLIGVKSDLQQIPACSLQQQHLETWQQSFPRLPLFPNLFHVSSKSSTGINDLLNTIESECIRIFSKHTTLIPASYCAIIKDLKTIQGKSAVHQNELFCKYSHGLTPEDFNVAMQYLHAIGRLVVLKKSKLIFPDPSIATQTAAKFVSPEEVRARLLGTVGVEILAKEQVGYLLNVAGTRLVRGGV